MKKKMRVRSFLAFSSTLIFGSLWGANFNVTNNADTGIGSLRNTITDLNLSPDPANTIIFDTGLGTINLSSDLPLITANGMFIVTDALEIDGENATISPYRVFGVQNVNITIQIPPSSGLLLLAGLVDGNGSLEGSGAGQLQLGGNITYTGGTVISGGLSLEILPATLLPASGAITINSSTLNMQFITPTSQIIGALNGTGSNGEIILGAKNLTVNSAISSTYPGFISGTGSFTKQNAGTLILTGANNYTGGTTVSGGVLQGNTTSLQGSILNNASVIFDQATTGTYAGSMSGTGSLTKQNTGTLILTGSNTYSGSTIVSGGVLQGDTTSLQGNISDSAEVIFNQTMTGTYAGVISGSGNLTKQGTGAVILTNDSSGFSTGTVNIDEGALIVNGILGGTVTLFGNTAILGGTGTIVGDVFNGGGSVQPGSSIGTLTINGNYTQNSGELVIEINQAGATDLLDVTGTATLNGVLHIAPDPGIYAAGTTYTFLTAGSVIGQFSSSFSDQPLDYAIHYFPTQVQLFLLGSSLVLPTRPAGNAGAVVDYLFCSSFDFVDADLNAVADALLLLPPNQCAKALNRLTPSQFGALTLIELENNFKVANSFFITGENQRSCYYTGCESTNIWINSLGFVYSQKNHPQLGQEATGFTNHTYGVAAGIDHLFSTDWKLGFGLGYSYSHLHWKNQVGKARSDSGYLGPYIGYNCGRFYFDFLILGAGNFYDVDRKIVFPGISRVASSHPTTWNLSEVVLAGFRLEPFYNFFVQPELLLDQLNSFQESFSESGANSIDLSVKRKYSSFLRSLINMKFVKEWLMCNTCLAPSVNVGWLRTTPLTGRHHTASFRKGTFCEPNFSVTSFSEVIDQVLVGAQFLISSQGGFSMSLGYDGRFGEGSKVNEINMALDWEF